jgi:hypothetical protein
MKKSRSVEEGGAPLQDFHFDSAALRNYQWSNQTDLSKISLTLLHGHNRCRRAIKSDLEKFQQILLSSNALDDKISTLVPILEPLISTALNLRNLEPLFWRQKRVQFLLHRLYLFFSPDKIWNRRIFTLFP